MLSIALQMNLRESYRIGMLAMMEELIRVASLERRASFCITGKHYSAKQAESETPELIHCPGGLR